MLDVLLALVVTFESRTVVVPERLIVGRAACAESVFILTETPELIEIFPFERKALVHPLRGLVAGDKVWGLGCLTDGSLWMLAAPRTVARVDHDGQVRERVHVRLPRVGLFGAADRLLVQQLPIASGASVLVTTPPRRPESVREWPGLLARNAGSREQQIATNVVNCGLGLTSSVPCWFVGANRVVVADGSRSKSLSWSVLNTGPGDPSAPIRDVAMAAGERYWLLATTLSRGRRVGGRLFRVSEGSADVLSLDLVPAARLIVFATETRCVLLTVNGTLMEVAAQP